MKVIILRGRISNMKINEEKKVAYLVITELNGSQNTSQCKLNVRLPFSLVTDDVVKVDGDAVGSVYGINGNYELPASAVVKLEK